MSGLVLGRFVGQTIKVDGPCVIQVDRIRGNEVRLRITADRNVTILRGELVASSQAKEQEPNGSNQPQ